MSKHPANIDDLLRDFVISIDGPSGAGKTTTARGVAAALGLRHLDTGSMYRAVTLEALERGLDPGDAAAVADLARSLSIDIAPDGRVTVNGNDVTEAIRTPEVTGAVSEVSAHPAVRDVLVGMQRRLAAGGGAVMEGRDIGSVVLPSADVKIYLDATSRVRAERRSAELAAAGVTRSVDDVQSELERRDAQDSARASSPLMRPVGSWRVDTSALGIDEQISEIVAIARRTAEERLALFRPPAPKGPRHRRIAWRVVIFSLRMLWHLLYGLRIRRRYYGKVEENYIFACNHIAYADPPIVGTTLPRELHFMAKDTLFRKEPFASLIRFFNAFPVRRAVFDREAMQTAMEILSRGGSLLIFPEGARVRGGALGEARGGIGYLAIQSGVPVVPVFVDGTDRLDQCLWRRDLTVVHGRPIRIPEPLLAELRAGDDREIYRRYGAMVMAAIAGLAAEAPRRPAVPSTP